MTDANNSGNITGTTAPTAPATGGNGLNCSGGTTIISGGQWHTITIPANTCATSGTIIFSGGQISFDDIDLAVPVDEKEEISDGCTCKKCKEYYQYAEPNQDDGTLICYGCRMVW